MIDILDFKKITEARLNTVKILIKSKDWSGAAYMMGYVLEIALKAMICKTLNLKTYPDHKSTKEIKNCFRTHEFESLLTLSGLSHIFSVDGDSNAFKNWSKFTMEYTGNWVEMRYDSQLLSQLSRNKVKRLYNCLIREDGILTIIKRKW